MTYFSLNQPDNGIFYVRRAIQTSPRNMMIRYILIKYTLRAENYDESLAALEDVFKYKHPSKNIEKRALGLYGHLASAEKSFVRIEEMMLMEFSVLLVELGHPIDADGILNLVECQSSYYQKVRNLVLANMEKKNKC